MAALVVECRRLGLTKGSSARKGALVDRMMQRVEAQYDDVERVKTMIQDLKRKYRGNGSGDDGGVGSGVDCVADEDDSDGGGARGVWSAGDRRRVRRAIASLARDIFSIKTVREDQLRVMEMVLQDKDTVREEENVCACVCVWTAGVRVAVLTRPSVALSDTHCPTDRVPCPL